MPPRHPHSSDTSRRGEQRPTLPPIRQLFGQELSQAVPPQQSRQPSNSPELPFHRLALTDDDRRYMSRSPAPGSQSGNSAIARPLPSSLHSAPRQPVTLSHPSNVVDPRYNTRAYESSQPPQYPAQSHGRNSPYAPRIPDGAIVASGSYPYPSYSSPMPPGPSAAFRSGTEMASTERSSSSRYECSYCGKGFTRPSSLKIHLNTHTGEKPFTCPYEGCGRSFSVQSNMRRHARVHERTGVTQPELDEEDPEEGELYLSASSDGSKAGESSTSRAEPGKSTRK